MQKILIATKNAGKVREYQEMFSPYGIEVQSLLNHSDIPDVEETGTTFEENAKLKAETIAVKLNIPVLADDSGLEVDALDNRPGIFSARYAGGEKNDLKNLQKVLEELKGVHEYDRNARFVCVIALARPGLKTVTKRGECEGIILTEPIGENGFGYDPIFKPNEYDKSMAQLKPEEKNSISHRYNALNQLKEWLKELSDQDVL